MSEPLRTPDEWMAIRHPGTRIMDPDGWRGKHGRPYTDPITVDEFEARYASSTILGTPDPRLERVAGFLRASSGSSPYLVAQRILDDLDAAERKKARHVRRALEWT